MMADVHDNYKFKWQNNRIEFVVNKLGKDFFRNKTILELGPFNGYIGNCFYELGANVTSIEGRYENVCYIKTKYPKINVIHADLDTPNWMWGHYDIIINWGILYHLGNFHEDNITNCIRNCDYLFLESVVFDSIEPIIFYYGLNTENGIDQSISGKAGIPTTSFIENLLSHHDCIYAKYCDASLNDEYMKYDWVETNSKTSDGHNRRFWIVKTKR